MEIYKDLNLLPSFKNAVLTIGSFDGVHIGHQQILKKIKNQATQIGGTSILITFHPHPRLIVSKDSHNLRLITTLDEKAKLLEHYGVDALVVVPFSKAFAAQTPDAYILDFLVAHFKPAVITIGYDHKFGKNRAGNISYLRKFEAEHGFKVVEISKQEVADIAVSSTKVRKALSTGDVGQAAQLMGHSFSLSGLVVKGQQIGAKIGFPTANIEVQESHKLIPPEGIYAVYVRVEGRRYGGMLYIGNRPTINQGLQQSIEVNIFDFNRDIYGHTIELEFVEYLRADQKFDELSALQEQLRKDKMAALKVIS